MIDLTRDGDTGLIVIRRFAAPPAALWQAHADPAMVRRWMLGPEGWHIDACEIDTRPGGTLHISWSNGMNSRFWITGEILETAPPHRMLHVERLHLPDPTPDTVIETVFTAEGSGTRMTQTMTLPDRQSRDAMLDSGMAEGMEASFARLDRLLGV